MESSRGTTLTRVTAGLSVTFAGRGGRCGIVGRVAAAAAAAVDVDADADVDAAGPADGGGGTAVGAGTDAIGVLANGGTFTTPPSGGTLPSFGTTGA